MSNNYTLIKDVFSESDKLSDFVNLNKSTLVYHKILSALQKPLKLILFYGKPGSGKTFLLHKIKDDLESKFSVVFFPQPYFDEKEFFYDMYIQIFKTPNSFVDSYESFIRLFKKNRKDENQVILLLDEAQLYPPNLIEKIRLLADTRMFKILFTVHKTDEEDTLAKDYFKTRIWSSIELPSSNLSELKLYIEKKLMFNKFHQFFYMYSDENFALVHELTKGNLRNVNKLLYKMYEICEYYDANKPTMVGAYFDNKIIEMAAIGTGLIDA